MKSSVSHHVLPVTAAHSTAEENGAWNDNIGQNLWNQQQSKDSLNEHTPNQRECESLSNGDSIVNNSSKRSESLPIQVSSNSSSNSSRSMSHPQNVNPNMKKKVSLKSVIDMKKNSYLTTKNGDESFVNVSDSELSDEFSSTNLSPQVHSNPYRLSVVSSNSSLSGGSSSNNQTSSSSPMHNNHASSSSSLIHALFPSLPIDRSKMSDEEFNIYKEVVSRPVFEKILKSKPLIAKCGYNEEYMKEFAFELSDEEELKRTYLTTDWVETAKLLKRTRSVEDGSIPSSVLQHAATNDEMNQSNAPTSTSDPTSPSSAADNNEDASSKEVTTVPTKSVLDQPHLLGLLPKRDSISSLEEALEKMVSDKEANTDLLKQELKIKLIITEIASNSSQKTLRQFLSPVLHKMNVLPEIGWFHSAILVGKWRLDFNDSSVVIPRKLVSQAAVITTDIESITTMQDLNRVIDGMAKCICKWNRNIAYKQTGGDGVTTGNCQDFVEDLLEHIGVKMNLSGSMKKFVKRLRRTGKCSLVFEMDKKFREHFKMETKRVKFKSHEQLDLFVRKLLESCPTFSQTFPDEWILLQSFDRTYWLKHMTYSHIDEYKPCKVIRDNRGVQDCPFHEPEFIQILKD
ncbi:hypothetical protein C9374_003148 [Naegleria lovaniensis]|uniref:Uncharacterized protein n=1 Tax=Naegleria lovaniensis TaxID=51637 RepID=A0AA88GUI4_NAELO|nr:uncharacterized protein C9374_003148 [Naegleria lovaniensis]KAG2385999.1 hypothetical protein C9374_003148 [Naegleria lovaniensis]